jgi:hypothetical protein
VSAAWGEPGQCCEQFVFLPFRLRASGGSESSGVRLLRPKPCQSADKYDRRSIMSGLAADRGILHDLACWAVYSVNADQYVWKRSGFRRTAAEPFNPGHQHKPDHSVAGALQPSNERHHAHPELPSVRASQMMPVPPEPLPDACRLNTPARLTSNSGQNLERHCPTVRDGRQPDCFLT